MVRDQLTSDQRHEDHSRGEVCYREEACRGLDLPRLMEADRLSGWRVVLTVKGFVRLMGHPDRLHPWELHGLAMERFRTLDAAWKARHRW